MSTQIRIDVRATEYYELDLFCNLPYEFTVDDIEDIAIKRFKTYEKNITPVIDYYKQTNLLKEVNGETPISEISGEISDLIEGIKG